MKSLVLSALILFQVAGDRGSIGGAVVRLGTSEPVAGARVLLAPVSGRLTDPTTITSDADGRFLFDNLLLGSYRIIAAQTGYLSAEFGQRTFGAGKPITLAQGQEVRGLSLILTPAGVITGRVLGSGRMLRNVTVKALQAFYLDGERVLKPVGETQTNDLGEYRLHSLAPGKYWIRAIPQAGQRIENGALVGWNTPYLLKTGAFIEPGAFDSNKPQPAFFPGVRQLSEAQSIELQAGQIYHATDMMLPTGAGLRIRGETINGATGQPIAADSLSIIRNSSDGGEDVTRNPLLDPLAPPRTASSNFEFSALAAGNYVLTARAGNLQARVPLTVSRDVDNLRVELRPAFPASGRIRIEGKPAADFDITRLSLRLIGTGISPPTTPGCDGTCNVYLVDVLRGTPDADGSFTISNAAAGLYTPSLLNAPAGFYVKSVRIGESDAAVSGFRLEERMQPLEIVISNATGVLDANVFDAAGKPAAAATVVLIPDSARNRFDLYRTATADPSGRVRLEGIVPGTYKAFAWEDIQTNSWQNAEVLKAFDDRGTPVTIVENAAARIEFQLIL
jgi:hypothetical protein